MPLRYARVCPNSVQFRHPDDGNKGGIGTTFPGLYGFGYEEWLGRADWIWTGPRFDWMDPEAEYRWGFLQAVRRQRPGSTHDIELFQITNSQRIAVGRIQECRRLTFAESEAAYDAWQAAGWLDTLRHEPYEIFNLCFRADDFRLLPAPEARPYPHSRYGILYH